MKKEGKQVEKSSKCFFSRKVKISLLWLVFAPLTIIVTTIVLGIVGFRIVYAPSARIDWEAMSAIGGFVGVIATTFVGIIAVYISKQANELVKKQEVIEQNKNNLRNVEKAVDDINYILSYNFIYTNVQAIQGIDWNVAKNLYNSEILKQINMLHEKQTLFHQREIIDNEQPYYNFVFEKFNKLRQIINESPTFQDAYDKMMKRDGSEIGEYIGRGIGFIHSAEINLFGGDIFMNKYPNRMKEYENIWKNDKSMCRKNVK